MTSRASYLWLLPIVLWSDHALAQELPLPATPEGAPSPTAMHYPLPEPVLREAGALFGAMRRSDAASTVLALRRLAQVRAEALGPDLTPVAAAFVALFDRATEHETKTGRAAIAAEAIPLAPDYPPLHFLLARCLLASGFQGLGQAATAMTDGLAAFVHYPRGLVTMAANAAFYLVIAMIAVAVAVAAMLLLRHLREVFHDVGDAFPTGAVVGFALSDMARSRRATFVLGSGLARTLLVLVLLLLLLLPLVLGAGLLLTSACWVLAMTPYARRTELVAAILVLLSIVVIPFMAALPGAPDRLAQAPGPALWTCLREHCYDTAAAQRRLQEQEDHTWARLALAANEVRRGPMRPAALESALLHLQSARPDSHGVVTAWTGNVLVLRALSSCEATGKPDAAALEAATKAFEGAPRNQSVLRGLAIARGLSGDRAGMEGPLKDLIGAEADVDLSSIVRIKTLTASPAQACQNAAVIARELSPPPMPDWSVYMSEVGPGAFDPIVPFPALLAGHVPPRAISICAGVGIAAMVVLLIARRPMKLACVCPRCGTVFCERCNRAESGFDFCPSCLLEKIRPAFLDPLDIVATQRLRNAWQHRGRVAVPVLALLVPGTGQVLAGRPVRGMAMLLLLATAVSMAAIPVAPVIDPVGYLGQDVSGLPLLPPVALALIYCLSALDVWLNRSR